MLPDNIGYINDRMGEYRRFAKEKIKDVNERRNFFKRKAEKFYKYK